VKDRIAAWGLCHKPGRAEVGRESAGDLVIIAALHDMSSRTRAASFGLALAAGGVLFAFDPAVTSWFPSCPLFALTGWLCPFCGSLRAFHALLHGHLGAALSFNPMTALGAVAGLAAAVHDTIRPARTALSARLVSLSVSTPGLALAAVFGVLRNVRSFL
jgi:hypothetical protein